MKISAMLCASLTAFVCHSSFAADLAEPLPACEERMGRVLSDFEQIRPGVTTRRDLRKLLRADGGAFGPSSERFVHPLCAYCKIKVTFRPQTQRPDGAPLISEDDPVVEVSKPYLEALFIG